MNHTVRFRRRRKKLRTNIETRSANEITEEKNAKKLNLNREEELWREKKSLALFHTKMQLRAMFS